MMTYQETIDFLFAQLPMFSRIGAAAYKKDLTNTIALCALLGNPQQRFKSIHIAGTNGKGSTSHMLAGILQNAGYKTGLYTSPHLHDFRERIKINGEMCSRDFVVSFTEKIKPHIARIEPSFFEITVAMAFAYFAEQEIDIAVIETGLGGRLDSTNIVMPELSIITNIGWDHMNMLGDTLEKIAGEKAGIIKPGIPVVIGETLPDTLPVFEKAAALSDMFLATEKRYVSDWLMQGTHLSVTVVEQPQNEYRHYELDLPGFYQTKNLLTVLSAVDVLRDQGWNITPETLHKALRTVKKDTGLWGRWDIRKTHPRVILDVGHNADGIKEINTQLELTNYHHLHIVFGMVRDKDADTILSLLPAHARYYFTKAQIPRALPETELLETATAKGLRGEAFADVKKALHAALDKAHPDDLILVCGSVFLVGEVDPGLWGW